MGARRDMSVDASSAACEEERGRRGTEFEKTLNRKPAHFEERRQAGFNDTLSRPIDLEENRSRRPAAFFGGGVDI